MLLTSPMKLLVVDQDTLGDHFLTLVLPPNKYQITEISSGKDAIQASYTMDPDVIIVNLLQPSSNGWKLCTKIREYSQTPILVLSAISDPNSIARWLDAGADDFLIKPISTDILIAHLQKLTRRTLLC